MCDINCCCCCYDNDAVDTSGTRSKVKYRKINTEDTASSRIVSEIDIVLPQYEKVPVDKIFMHQQPLPQFMYVHPQLFQKNESNETAITQQPQTGSISSAQQESGDRETTQSPHSYLELSMYYDMQRRVLTVYLNSAEIGTDSVCSKTIALNYRKEPTVFVVLFLIPHKEQVLYSVTKKIVNPYFDQKFEFTGLLPDEIRRQSLVLQLLEKCKNTQNELGTAIISLEHADLYGISMRQPVKPIDQHKADHMLHQFHSNGSILLSLMHDSSSFIISGVVLKAKNLRKMDVSGLSDPYVKIYLIYKGSRVYKWKSTVKKKTLAPIYNETFQFTVTEMDMHFVQLELKVIDHDILGSNHLMGTVELGSKSEHSTGKTHWTEMTSSPCNQICYWHSLKEP